MTTTMMISQISSINNMISNKIITCSSSTSKLPNSSCSSPAPPLLESPVQVLTNHTSINYSSSSDSGSGRVNSRREMALQLMTAVGSTMMMMNLGITGRVMADSGDGHEYAWGTRSLLLEKYFMPGLSPDEAAARIKQTAQGMHGLRHMMDTMSWRYLIFYIRVKINYLESDLKNALSTLPENQQTAYVRTANELVDNMSQLDDHVRTPNVYQSYLYYEKTLKSLDDLVAMLG